MGHATPGRPPLVKASRGAGSGVRDRNGCLKQEGRELADKTEAGPDGRGRAGVVGSVPEWRSPDPCLLSSAKAGCGSAAHGWAGSASVSPLRPRRVPLLTVGS